jgi:hypothetical protein
MGKDMPSSEIDEVTQRKWRDLGFFCDRDDDAKEWRLIGANAGLRQFAHAMQKYAAKPSNHLISEPKHFGPYNYLAVGTWTTFEITDHWKRLIRRDGNDSTASELTGSYRSGADIAAIFDNVLKQH